MRKFKPLRLVALLSALVLSTLSAFVLLTALIVGFSEPKELNETPPEPSEISFLTDTCHLPVCWNFGNTDLRQIYNAIKLQGHNSGGGAQLFRQDSATNSFNNLNNQFDIANSSLSDIDINTTSGTSFLQRTGSSLSIFKSPGNNVLFTDTISGKKYSIANLSYSAAVALGGFNSVGGHDHNIRYYDSLINITTLASYTKLLEVDSLAQNYLRSNYGTTKNYANDVSGVSSFTICTVTSGKIYYVTDMILSLENTSTGGRELFIFKDGSTAFMMSNVPANATGFPNNNKQLVIHYNPPFKVANSIVLNTTSSSIICDYQILGYEK